MYHADRKFYDQTPDPRVNSWGVVKNQSLVVPSTGLDAPSNTEFAAPATSYITQTDGCIQPSYLSMLQPQQIPTGTLGWDRFLAGTMAFGTPTVPGIVAPEYWVDNSSCPYPYISANPQTPYQVSGGPGCIEGDLTGQFQPCGTYRTLETQHVDAVAGPAQSLVQYGGPQMAEPAGRSISDSTAKQDTTRSKQAKDPNNPARMLKYRAQSTDLSQRLFTWAKAQSKEIEIESFNNALAEAVKFVAATRPTLYRYPYLAKTGVKTIAPLTKNAQRERERRNTERELYEQLSMYYRPPGRKAWTRSRLLAHVLEDLENPSAREDQSEDSDSREPTLEIPGPH